MELISYKRKPDSRSAGELYRWQNACLSEWEKQGFRGIVQAVTGSGKTRLAIACIRRLQELHPQLYVKIVVPTIPLAGQWLHALTEAALCEEERPGLIGGGRCERDMRHIKVYIINSARMYLAPDIKKELAQNHSVLLICDECHHCLSKENRGIFQFLNPEGRDASADLFSRYASLGLSATPFSDTSDIGEDFPFHALGSLIYRYNLSDAVSEGVISSYCLCNLSVSFLNEEREAYDEISLRIHFVLKKLLQQYPRLKNTELSKQQFMKEVTQLARKADMDPEDPAAAFLLLTYERKKLCVLADARMRCCVDLIGTLHPTDRIIIFTERIEQAEAVFRQISKKYGSCSSIYHSGMTPEARKRVLGAFRDHAFRILVTCRCLDEGIDVPDANIAIVLSGSSVPRQHIQRLGRVIRRSEGKDAACLYYLYIREAAEDNVYLTRDISESTSFELRYEADLHAFENELYIYTCLDLMEAARRASPDAARLKEMRACMNEGLTRADYLLPEETLQKNIRSAASRHRKNYWKVMCRIHESIL